MLRRWVLASTLVLGCSSADFTTPGDSGLTASDAPAADAISTLPTTGTDAAADGTPASGFCSTITPTPYLCADWDEGGSPQQGFDATNHTGGDVAIDTTVAFSHPGALRTHVPALGTNSDASLVKLRPFSPTAPQSIAFQVRYAPICTTLAAGGDVLLFAIGVFTATGSAPVYSVSLYASAGAVDFVEYDGSSTKSHPVGALSGDRFAHVGASLAPDKKQITVTFDGGTPQVISLDLFKGDVGSITQYALSLGQTRTAPATAECTVYYDNFVWY
jgi:hypothetical protein